MLNTYHDKFIKLCKNYLININIKKLKAFKYKFNDSFTLYYHNLNDNNWTFDSYIKIYKFDNIAQFWILFNNHKNLCNGMYFLMKNEIKPLYEDIANKNGGYWSIKISQYDINKIWLNLVLDLVGNNLSDKNIINGLSLVYKKKFYIIKIWIKNKKYNELKYLNISLNNKKYNIIYNNFFN